jgi:hypothetical protein
LPPTVKAGDAAELFKDSAPKYRGLAGLVRKYYLYNESGIGGGVYLWESRAAAERVYTAEWKKMIADRYGTEPEISYYDTPVVVDNAIDAIQVDAAE